MVICDEDKFIHVMSPAYVGSSHDFAIFKEESTEAVLPCKTPIYLDTGYEGIKNICPNHNIKKPKKKPKSRQLNGGEKHGNRCISRVRVKVEHSIRGLKLFNITSQRFRGITMSNDLVNKVSAGLANLHISSSLKNSVVLDG